MNPVTPQKRCFFSGFLYHPRNLLIPIGQNTSRDRETIMAEGRWYSVAEVAEHLGVTPQCLYKWLQRKDLPAHKVGKLWKFKLDEIDAWVKADKGNSRFEESSAAKVKRSAI